MIEPSPGSDVGARAAGLVGDTYGRGYRPFELLGLSGSVAILLIAGLEFRRQRRRSLADVVPVVVPILVAFVFLGLVVEYSRRSWDYRCYENAAKALVAGVGAADDADDGAWFVVFYLYQCLQLLAVNLVLPGAGRFATTASRASSPTWCASARSQRE